MEQYQKSVDPVAYLTSVDPVLATVINILPRPKWQKRQDYFRALVEQIVNQQLSEKAADTIFARFLNIFHDKKIVPEIILKIDDDQIRKAGISYAKISYIKNLAQKTINKQLQFERIHDFTDAQVTQQLIEVKGIGVWTAEMFLIFTLAREDVFSYGDLGLRNAMKKLYKFRKHPTPKQADKISAKWKPYRSWACRYLWASLDIK